MNQGDDFTLPPGYQLKKERVGKRRVPFRLLLREGVIVYSCPEKEFSLEYLERVIRYL